MLTKRLPFVFTVFLQALLLNFGLSPLSVADDIDIFSKNVQAKPNIMFVLDTSQSMETHHVLDENGNNLGTRLEVLKRTLHSLISDMADVNVGIMQYRDFLNLKGADVVQVVKDIDAPVKRHQLAKIMSPNDDAHERMSTGEIGYREGDTVGLLFGHTRTLSTTTVSMPELNEHISGYAQESVATGQNSFSTKFEVMADNIIGLRFPSAGLTSFPDLSAITASIELTSSETYSDPIELELKGEIADTPAAFSTAVGDLNNRWNLSSTTASAIFKEYTTEDLDDANETETDIGIEWPKNDTKPFDITNVIQEMLSQATFQIGEDLVLLLKAEKGGIRELFHSGSNAPALKIEYQGAPSALDYTYEKLMTGLRFDRVPVPQGATIKSARIRLEPYGFQGTEVWKNDNNWRFLVTAEDSANPAPFTDADYALSSRTKTPSIDSTVWTRDNNSQFTQQNIIDVTSLVSGLVSRTDWCAQQAMAFFFEPDTSNPLSKALLNARENPNTFFNGVSQLTVEYTTSGTPGCYKQQWEQMVAETSHDAIQSAGGAVDLYETEAILEPNTLHGFHFRDVPIEPNTTIQEAYIELAATKNTNPINVQVFAEKVSDAEPFKATNNDLGSRTPTTTRLTGTIAATNQYVAQRTPNIAAVIQEIVDNGWSRGNALNLFLKPTNGNFDYYTLDRDLMAAPRLIIKMQQAYDSEQAYTVREHLKSKVANLTVDGLTPTVGALYEAARYFRGLPAELGRADGNILDLANKVWVEDRYIKRHCTNQTPISFECQDNMTLGSSEYVSPIENDCASNHIVFLTDGIPNSNNNQAKVNALIPSVSSCEGDSTLVGEQCARTLVKWMANNDMANHTQHSHLDQTLVHPVYTHTIAFGVTDTGAKQFLDDLADLGKGEFYDSTTALDLANTFHAIITSVLADSKTFVQPSVSIDQFNRLVHSNSVYFSFFEAAQGAYWPGNFKKYQYAGTPPVIKGENGKDAVNPATGEIYTNIQSFWSNGNDGDNIAKGGAANVLPLPASRKLYTYVPDALNASKTLSNPVNALKKTNTALTPSVFGLSTESSKDDLIDWIRGQDVLDINENLNRTESRHQLGSIIHSAPASVTYQYDEAAGTTETTLFVGTNEGYLHAFDAESGEETFAFMPETFFNSLETQYRNVDGHPLVYGFDGEITVWKQDIDGDGIGGPGANAADDHVYLYAGMRRGGREYYGLDVTNLNQPKILWDHGSIKGGSTLGFEKLGQTWSKPVLTKIKKGNTAVDVLVFAGGFDPKYDTDTSVRPIADVGNALYIVNAKTGDLIWRASNSAAYHLNLPDMRYAIPSQVSVIDLNLDGLADRFFVGDLGGQVWRFDLSVNTNGDTHIDGGVIAQVVPENTELNDRRFFHKPSVSRFTLDGVTKMAIAIGSGERNEPLQTTTENHFYVIFQPVNLQSSYGVPLQLDGGQIVSAMTETPDVIEADGWYISLRPGEKALSTPLTINGSVIFTTYQAPTSNGTCEQGEGNAYAYQMNIVRANASWDFNGDGVVNVNDRSTELVTTAIPPQPKLVILEGEAPMIVIGMETLSGGGGNGSPSRGFEWQTNSWHESKK